VQVYDNTAFDAIMDLPTAEAAPHLARDTHLHNLPVVAAP
jgi:hypothetical protein